MVDQNEQLIRIDAGVFWRGPEKKLRVAHNVLIERRTGRNQDAQGRAIASTGPPETLPGAGDGAGIAVEETDIQRPNIDAKLQRRSSHNALQISGPHFRFRVTPLRGNIAASVGSDTRPM